MDGGRRTMPDILRTVSRLHLVTPEELIAQDRRKRLVLARQEFMARAYETPTLSGRMRSLPEIGRFLGGRDHTTILHGVNRHRERTA